MTNVQKLWETHKRNLWQKTYDKGFCDGLDKGLTLDEACDYADMYVLKATKAMIDYGTATEEEYV